jgi:hypothetical protein
VFNLEKSRRCAGLFLKKKTIEVNKPEAAECKKKRPDRTARSTE